MTLVSATILLFVVMDAFGNLPLFVSALDAVPVDRRQKVVVRELLIAFTILVVALFLGPYIMVALQISSFSLRIAGGIILFLIAVKMVFGGTQKLFIETPEGEPFIVPLAVPYVAGPSATATVLLLVGQYPSRWPEWLLALALASLANAAILLLATRLIPFLGVRGLCAIERLMGLLLTAVAVEMFLDGIRLAF
jgi:MarC family membrane protein